MLEAMPLGIFSRRYAVTDSGRPVAQIAFGRWKQHDTIERDGRRLSVRSEGWWRPKLKLEEHGRLLSCAMQGSTLGRCFYFAFGDDEYELRPVGVFSRAFELARKGRPLGRVWPQGVLSRRVAVGLEEGLSLEVRLFTLWLALLAWHRAAAMVAATT